MPDVGRKVEYLLNTGNLVSKSGLDLSQVSGFTVVAEKLNFFRYLSHFRYVDHVPMAWRLCFDRIDCVELFMCFGWQLVPEVPCHG